MAPSNWRWRIFWVVVVIAIIAAALVVWPWFLEKWRDAQKLRIDPRSSRAKDWGWMMDPIWSAATAGSAPSVGVRRDPLGDRS